MNWMTRPLTLTRTLTMTRPFTRISNRGGQTMTEYALILATIAAVVISLFQTSGAIVQSLMGYIDGSL